MVLLNLRDTVAGRVVEVTRDGKGRWVLREVQVPQWASVTASALDRHEGDDYQLRVTGFTTPQQAAYTWAVIYAYFAQQPMRSR